MSYFFADNFNKRRREKVDNRNITKGVAQKKWKKLVYLLLYSSFFLNCEKKKKTIEIFISHNSNV